MGVTVLLWLVPLTHRFGGRDPGVVTLGLLILIPGLLLTGVTSLPRRHLLALLPGATALVAVLVSPRRGDGLDEAAMWLAAGLMYLAVAAWLRRGVAPATVGVLVLVAGLDQFFAAWWPWFGEGDAAGLMRGTFFWHNQFAAFMVACGLVAAAIVLFGAGRVRLLAAVSFVACVAGTYYSTSRASLALLMLGCLVAMALSWRSPKRIAALAALGGVSATLTWFLSSSLLMSAGGVTSGFVARTNNVAQNGMTRVEYWKAALDLVRAHPLTGTGADSFGTAGMAVVGDSAMPSTLVHNGFLQAFVDGGILLGGSVVACALTVLGIAAAVLWRTLRHGGAREAAWRIGAALGVGALVLHAAVDFDWTYPSLLVLAAILAALVIDPAPGARSSGVVAAGRSRRGALPMALGTGLAVVLGLMASGAQDFAAPTGPVSAWRTVATLGVASDDGQVRVPQRIRPVGDCLTDLRRWIAADRVAAPPADLMACTAASAASDPWTVTLRASAVARSGDLATADAMAAPAVALMAPVNGRFALVPIQLALLAKEPAQAAGRVPAAAAALGAAASEEDRAELKALRLQIARELPMSTQGTSQGSADVVRTNERGAR